MEATLPTQTTRKSGENHVVAWGSTTLGSARPTEITLTLQTADARASGDYAPFDVALGQAKGEVICSYLISDEATLPHHGTRDTRTLKDSDGATVFAATCLCRELRRHENYLDMTIVDAVFSVQGLPTTPSLAAITASTT